MTKEAYFEMCEQLGSEPIESEIPVTLEDFSDDVLTCFSIYNILPLSYTGMGDYIGKSLQYIHTYFDLFDIKQDRLVYLKIITLMDNIERDILNKKAANKPK